MKSPEEQNCLIHNEHLSSMIAALYPTPDSNISAKLATAALKALATMCDMEMALNKLGDRNRPLIFLDVDGVLNQCGKTIEKDMICRWCMMCLKQIIDEVRPYIVISSTWRYLPHRLETLLPHLEKIGAQVVGYTPHNDSKSEGGIYVGARSRGEEIQQWMDENWAPKTFVILDDDTDMGELRKHLILTDSSRGLTQTLTAETIEALK